MSLKDNLWKSDGDRIIRIMFMGTLGKNLRPNLGRDVTMMLCGLGNERSGLKTEEENVLVCGGPLKLLGDQDGRERVMTETEFLGSPPG